MPPVVMALLLAAAVAAAMVAIGAHQFTDAVGGAAVGTAVVLACALTLDLAAADCREDQRRHLFLAGDQRRAPSRMPGPAMNSRLLASANSGPPSSGSANDQHVPGSTHRGNSAPVSFAQ